MQSRGTQRPIGLTLQSFILPPLNLTDAYELQAAPQPLAQRHNPETGFNTILPNCPICSSIIYIGWIGFYGSECYLFIFY